MKKINKYKYYQNIFLILLFSTFIILTLILRPISQDEIDTLISVVMDVLNNPIVILVEKILLNLLFIIGLSSMLALGIAILLNALNIL